ncbi:uncharacterized protein LOC108469368 isoform X1 [Gossypium arboreum]|uniref:uncharacterized protein LOC108469368 isoform X1 n=1 Tax=Gossypium arboreum TaxID=29729 RepID=UPI0022F1C877|nr:uncharacterized protein LOC108469368 isoform X1 [Gossypium arboreum]
MSGESSEQPRKRGRPIHLPAGNQKTNKRITDRKAGQENRDIVVGLTEAAPILKELLEAFSSINEGDLLQTIRNIGDARARWNEGVQWQQDEEGNSTMPCIQEIKDAMSEAVSKVVLPLRNDLQNVMQTMPNVNLPIASQALGCQYNQNPVQSDAFAEQSPLGLPFCEEPGINIMCSTSTCDENGEKFDDEQVTIFLQEWDGNTKGQVQYSDFNELQEELRKVELNCFPSFLDPILIQKIKDAYGDITEKSNSAAVQLILRLSCSIPR